MAKYKNGEAFIEILDAHGVDKVFINPGFEHNAIQVSVAAARRVGRAFVKGLTRGGENVI
ncbi:MAG: hypothetical protein FWF33_03680 [Clostridiales bacterium]|nr:hypothetical protein [Clostridiales bacterium]